MKKLFSVTAALLVLGSAFLCGCAGGGRVAEGVEIDGVYVGGMRYAEAERAVREVLMKDMPPLVVHAPAGDTVFTEFTLKDDLPSLVRTARNGERLKAKTERIFPDAEERLSEVCERNAKEGRDATLFFSSEGFEYTRETNAVACDMERLKQDVFSALKGGMTEVTLSVYEIPPAVTEESLKKATAPMSAFETYFDANNEPRTENIRLASSKISGTTILPHEEFSFNTVVGKRTAENGYRESTVIQDGVFTKGIGGGVCQVSTTLFNAALKAGMTITESRNHSLSISYVPPSLDAMVSEYSDLKFVNPFEFPVYILSEVEGGKVEFSFFGFGDGMRYETESKVLMRLKPPAPKYVEGKENACIRSEKEGIASESYLIVYDALGNFVSRTLIRRDSYAAVQGVYEVAPE